MFVQELNADFEAALESRTPFVVRGIARDWPARGWKLEDFDSSINPDNLAQYWYHLPQDRSYSEGLPCPDWLSGFWRRRESRLSLERPIRLWQASRGHRTPWHYDGNALDVINVQLTGAKHFTLTSPKNELPYIRFQPISTLAYADAEVPTLEVTLTSGDLIFIPRFWNHRVRALKEINRNVNWVWTDSTFTADSAVAVREAERLAAIKKLDDAECLDELLTGHEAEYLRQELYSYGGYRNADLVPNMLDQVPSARIDARIQLEIEQESADEFISRLDPRGQKLLALELFGRTSAAENIPVDG